MSTAEAIQAQNTTNQDVSAFSTYLESYFCVQIAGFTASFLASIDLTSLNTNVDSAVNGKNDGTYGVISDADLRTQFEGDY